MSSISFCSLFVVRVSPYSSKYFNKALLSFFENIKYIAGSFPSFIKFFVKYLYVDKLVFELNAFLKSSEFFFFVFCGAFLLPSGSTCSSLISNGTCLFAEGTLIQILLVLLEGFV